MVGGVTENSLWLFYENTTLPDSASDHFSFSMLPETLAKIVFEQWFISDCLGDGEIVWRTIGSCFACLLRHLLVTHRHYTVGI